LITEQDLREAIAECQGQRNPNANTCIKLAAFYILQDHLYGDANKPLALPSYSFAANNPAADVANHADTIHIDSDSEFAQSVNGRKPDEIWPIIDELVMTVQVVNPPLYNAVMRKLDG